ncbi:alpha/beta fold hydrolase [Caldalkalibacillus salinus]|uniref:alpha/beta fold hydrolase n=1 Tax=Caldalkalibacillus salinus TaxID=2803787 RepID=UPI00192133A7
MRHYYEIHGQENKEWLILLHGAGGSTRMWYKQVQAFAKHFKVLVYDIRGHGETLKQMPVDEADYSFDMAAHDLKQLLQQLNIKQAHFCGVSFGTMILQRFVVHYRHMVKSLIFGGLITKYSWFIRGMILVGDKLLVRWCDKDIVYRLFAYLFMPKKRHAAARKLFIRESKKVTTEAFLKWWRAIQKERIFESLPTNINIPTLVMMGDEDHVFLKTAKLIHQKFTNVTFRVFQKCGHVCSLEKPKQFNQYTIDFILSLTSDNAKKVAANE